MNWSALNTVVSKGKIIESSEVLDLSPPVDTGSYRWLLINWNDENVKNWLINESGIDELISEQLFANETRPRTNVYSDGFLINFRGVNLNDDEDPEDMLSVRMFVTNDTVITVIVRGVQAINDMKAALTKGKGPDNTQEFICMLLEFLTDKAEPIINKLGEDAIDIEDEIINRDDIINRDVIVEIRKTAVSLLRYFVPQKDAVAKLIASKNNFFTTDDKEYLEVSLNRLKRFLEELELIKEKCHLLNDEIRIQTSERLSKNMYLLSVITAIFLPLGFLTGLFGINLGGMPGAEYKWGGFWIFFFTHSGITNISDHTAEKE